MKLYKYRSLNDLNYVVDILVQSRLYCSRYLDLNDPFEGLFSATIHVPPQHRLKYPCFLLPDSHSVTKTVADLHHSSRDKVRICSLSSSLRDVRLWSHYADGNRGVALEIDFSGLEAFVHEVVYSEALPSYGSTLLTEPAPVKVLTHKTCHWSYESEYRILYEDEYFDIAGRLKAIYVGFRTKDIHVALLEKVKPVGVPLIRTEVDARNVEIRGVAVP